MYKTLNIIILPVIFILYADVFPANKIFCDQCGNEVKAGSSYLMSGEKIYCDEECFEKNLPKCMVCGKSIRQGFVQESRNYCSTECLQTTWKSCFLCGKRISGGVEIGGAGGKFYCPECSKMPVCFACGYPGNCADLPDGRKMCPDCEEASVKTYEEALSIFLEVRAVMKNKLKLYTRNTINFSLVDKNLLEKKSEKTGEELGLFVHEKFIETETSTKTLYGFEIDRNVKTTQTDSLFIYMLDHMPKAKFLEVAAHEIAHDWMDKNYPNIKNLKIIEGWAEFVASKINIIYRNEKMNERMKENPDNDYGDGYRYISDYVQANGMKKLFSHFKSLNRKKKP